MWNKSELIQVLENQLLQELEAAIRASREAAAHATDEESRATSKWDTQGLEASYLAAGQAQQAKELESTRLRLRSSAAELSAAKHYGTIGALISCKIGSAATEHFWLVPEGAGGRDLPAGKHTITCLNAQSPLGRTLLGKSAGDSFALPNGSSGVISAIS